MGAFQPEAEVVVTLPDIQVTIVALKMDRDRTSNESVTQ